MRKFLMRFREPSTYAGLAGGLAALGLTLPPDQFQAVVAAGTGVAGLLAMVLPEAGSDDR